MIHAQERDHSEIALIKLVTKNVDAGAPVIQVRAREPIRAAMAIRRSILESKLTSHKEWDVVNGFRLFTKEDYDDNTKMGLDPVLDATAAFDSIFAELRDRNSAIYTDNESVHYRVFLDFHPFLKDNPYLQSLLQQYVDVLAFKNIVLILVTPEVNLPDISPGTIPVIDMDLPTIPELIEVCREAIKDSDDAYKDSGFVGPSDISDEEVERLANVGAGLTSAQFAIYASYAIIDAQRGKDKRLSFQRMYDAIAAGKTEVVKESDILELLPSLSMEDVGGMDRLKDWIQQRANCYTPEAEEFGIDSPKGMVVVGVPGTGKSLIAKCIGSALGVPVVRFDMSAVFSKFVGDSEGRVRSALKMIEAMAPCVCFVDEIDKGLGGLQGGGSDSGTSSRVLGNYLTWLAECQVPIFNVVTANKVDGLPPELLRQGRFDGVFSVGLPSIEQRRQVLEIHVRKRKDVGLDEFEKAEVTEFLTSSDRYVPAEIEGAVKNGLIIAFALNEEFAIRHALQALREMVPMARAHEAAINRMAEWGKTNATPVEYEGGSRPGVRKVSPPRRRIGRGN